MQLYNARDEASCRMRTALRVTVAVKNVRAFSRVTDWSVIQQCQSVAPMNGHSVGLEEEESEVEFAGYFVVLHWSWIFQSSS